MKKISAGMLLVCVFIMVSGCGNGRVDQARTALAEPANDRTAIQPVQAVSVKANLLEETAPLETAKRRTNTFYAHRGYSSIAPENTLPAFRLGFDKGAEGIELDMQMSKDGKVVVMHDFTLDRTTNGRGPLKERSLAELGELDCGSWFKKGGFAGTKIPTLQSVFQAVDPKPGQTVITEIKDYRSPSDVEIMMKVIIDGGWEKNTMVSSFRYGDFAYVRKHSKTVPIGFLCDSGSSCKKAIQLAKEDPHAMIHASYWVLLAEPEVSEEARKSGVEMTAWTVNKPEIRQQLELLGIHRFITDEPEKIRESL